MNLQQKRLAANLQGKQVALFLRETVDHRIEPGLYSKMESGLCLPTPKQFGKICELFKADPASIYTPEEVDFGIPASKPPRGLKEPKEPDTYKLTVRLPKRLASGLSAKLKRNGYTSITAYVCECIRKLK